MFVTPSFRDYCAGKSKEISDSSEIPKPARTTTTQIRVTVGLVCLYHLEENNLISLYTLQHHLFLTHFIIIKKKTKTQTISSLNHFFNLQLLRYMDVSQNVHECKYPFSTLQYAVYNR